jgi:hypothetical protein
MPDGEAPSGIFPFLRFHLEQAETVRADREENLSSEDFARPSLGISFGSTETER